MEGAEGDAEGLQGKGGRCAGEAEPDGGEGCFGAGKEDGEKLFAGFVERLSAKAKRRGRDCIMLSEA